MGQVLIKGVRTVVRALLPSPVRTSRLWEKWYRYVDRRLSEQPLRFLNYGLALRHGESLPLDPADENERLSIQLYDRVVSAADLAGATVLEVSCGRGGGADYLARYKDPARVVGLDRTDSAVAFCRRAYPGPRLQFVCGNALSLPFPDGQFDAVVNVEASHCYPDFPKFLSEVRRVLRPGGSFLYADFRRKLWQKRWHDALGNCGLEMVLQEDVTDRVLESLTTANDEKKKLIRRIAPLPLRGAFAQFAGTKGSMMYWAFRTRRANYVRFCLRRA